MKELSKDEMKRIIGGDNEANYCGSKDIKNCCNMYCGEGSNVTCSGQCSICDDAGGGQNPNVPGGDKLCTSW